MFFFNSYFNSFVILCDQIQCLINELSNYFQPDSCIFKVCNANSRDNVVKLLQWTPNVWGFFEQTIESARSGPTSHFILAFPAILQECLLWGSVKSRAGLWCKCTWKCLERGRCSSEWRKNRSFVYRSCRWLSFTAYYTNYFLCLKDYLSLFV